MKPRTIILAGSYLKLVGIVLALPAIVIAGGTLIEGLGCVWSSEVQE